MLYTNEGLLLIFCTVMIPFSTQGANLIFWSLGSERALIADRVLISILIYTSGCGKPQI